LEYFDGALADAPASARPDTNSEPERSVSAPAMITRHLFISASIWFETTQTEQAWIFAIRRFLSTTLFGVFLSQQMMIPTSGNRKNHQQMPVKSAGFS
jgi:hypothetical protein